MLVLQVILRSSSHFVHGQDSKERDAYILTQAPLDNTIGDFWRMISQYNIGTVVMLNNLKEGKQVSHSSLMAEQHLSKLSSVVTSNGICCIFMGNPWTSFISVWTHALE